MKVLGRMLKVAGVVVVGFAVAVFIFLSARSSAQTAQGLLAVLDLLIVIATITAVLYTIRQVNLSKQASDSSARDALIARLDPRGPRVSVRHVRIEFYSPTATTSEDDTGHGPSVHAIAESDKFFMAAKFVVENYGNEPAHLLIGDSTLGGFDTQPDFALPPGEVVELSWEAGFYGRVAKHFAEQGGWLPGSWNLKWSASTENLEGSVRDILLFEDHYKPFGHRSENQRRQAVWYSSPLPFQRWGQYANLRRTYPRVPENQRARFCDTKVYRAVMPTNGSSDQEDPPGTSQASNVSGGPLARIVAAESDVLVVTISWETPNESRPVTELEQALIALTTCLDLDAEAITVKDAFDYGTLGDWWVTIPNFVSSRLARNGYIDLHQEGWRITAEFPNSVSTPPMDRQ